MAVISELIDLGLQLKEQGKHKAAIEHFRQLHSTYPGNARIMFELAASWGAFSVPEQALPLYRQLMALPKGQGLPPKDVPRLYARLGATLYAMREYQEALTVIEEGLRLHPSYRTLRALRILSLNVEGSPQHALIDALELMLESLAPSRWDIFEEEIRQMVGDLRDALGTTGETFADMSESGGQAVIDDAQIVALPIADDLAESSETKVVVDAEADVADNLASEANALRRIDVSDAADEGEDFELDVRVVQPAKKARIVRKKAKKGGQFGERAVRIDINAASADDEQQSDDEKPAPPEGKVTIPIDFD